MESIALNDQERIDQIFSLTKDAALESGNILMHYRGHVVNEEKEEDPTRDQEFQAEHTAKTIVDEILQELFLANLYRIASAFREKIRINVEEDTPLKNLFLGNEGSLCTVHQDACDGTKDYLDGGGAFAAGFGISDSENDFTHTAICVPARNEAYFSSSAGSQFIDMEGNELPIPLANVRKIFEKRILSSLGRKILEKEGFQIACVTAVHSTVIDVALGRAAAVIYGLSKPHDSFVPYAFAKERGALLVDIQGHPLTGRNIHVTMEKGFPHFHTLPSVCYFGQVGEETEKIRSFILDVLSDTKNLHPTYLRDRDKFTVVR